jgi:hypothetical protein
VTFSLTWDRENDDVRIEDASFSKTRLTCDRTTSLRVTIKNYGSDDQDQARIVVYSEDLDYLNRDEMDIELYADPFDTDNRYTASYSIRVPANYNGNTVDFTVWTFYDTSDSDHPDDITYYKRDLSLEVGPCAATTTTYAGATTTQYTPVTLPPTTTLSPDAGYDSIEVPFTETPTYTAILVLVNIVVIGLVIALIVWAFRRH